MANFYLKSVEDILSETEGLHLGLSTGSMFMFRAYPEKRIISVKSLERYLRRKNDKIITEYGDLFTIDEFLIYVQSLRRPDNIFKTTKTVNDRRAIKEDMRFKDPDGYLFYNYEFC